jgi:hypothetical protein
MIAEVGRRIVYQGRTRDKVQSEDFGVLKIDNLRVLKIEDLRVLKIDDFVVTRDLIYT